MEHEDLVLKVANCEGEIKAFKDMFIQHNKRDDERFNTLIEISKENSEKLNKLLIREAGRDGEAKGIKRSAGIIATIISLICGLSGVALAIYVG